MSADLGAGPAGTRGTAKRLCHVNSSFLCSYNPIEKSSCRSRDKGEVSACEVRAFRSFRRRAFDAVHG